MFIKAKRNQNRFAQSGQDNMYLKSPGKTAAGWKQTSEKEFDIRLNLNLDTLLYSVRMGNRSDQVVSSWPSYLPSLN